MEIPNKAVILAGGLGTRLRPLTYEIPKSLIPLQGKPVIEHIIELFRNYGIDNLIFSLGYKAEQFIRYFGNGKKFGVSIDYIVEERPLGTGGSLCLARDKLNSSFYCCSGDNLIDIDLEDLYSFHCRQKTLGTLVLTPIDDVSEYGVVTLVDDKLQSFIEKPSPKNAPSNLINVSFYVFEPGIIDIIPKDKAVSLEGEIFPKLAKNGRLAGYQFDGQWFPTDDWKRYERALKRWKGLEL